jgi:hypothetical protein
MIAWGFFMVVGAVHAELLVGWDVSGVDVDNGVGLITNQPLYRFVATTNAIEHVSAELTLGDGVNPSTSANQYGFKISTATYSTTLAFAIQKKQYLEFSITVDEGFELNLQSIVMKGQSSGLGCSSVVVMTSIDGFVAGQEIASTDSANKTGGFDTDQSGFGEPIDLTAPAYQNLTGTISFRIYGWNSSSGSSATYIRNLTGNDLIVNGTVAELSPELPPTLSVVHSNGTTSVSVAFEGRISSTYLLQYRENLINSSNWITISEPFSTNSTWQVEPINRWGFYRAVAE